LIFTTSFLNKASSNRIHFSPDEHQPPLIISVFLFNAVTKVLVTFPDILKQRNARFFDLYGVG
jgi:hypothetical protein